MDEWVKCDRIIHFPSEANIREANRKNEEAAAVLHATLSGLDDPKAQSQHPKRKREGDENVDGPTTIDELEHDEHEGLDEAR